MKKVLIIIGILAAISASFFGGVKYQQRQSDKIYSASLGATNSFVDAVTSPDDANRISYDQINDTYRNAVQKEDFDKINEKLKKGTITNIYTLTSPIENQSYYTIQTSENKTVTLIVSSTKVDGKWIVTKSSLVDV